MPIIKELTEFTEFFVLENSIQVYGIAGYNPHISPVWARNAEGIVWKYEYTSSLGYSWVTTGRDQSGSMYKNRVIRIKNIKLLHKNG